MCGVWFEMIWCIEFCISRVCCCFVFFIVVMLKFVYFLYCWCSRWRYIVIYFVDIDEFVFIILYLWYCIWNYICYRICVFVFYCMEWREDCFYWLKWCGVVVLERRFVRSGKFFDEMCKIMCGWGSCWRGRIRIRSWDEVEGKSRELFRKE